MSFWQRNPPPEGVQFKLRSDSSGFRVEAFHGGDTPNHEIGTIYLLRGYDHRLDVGIGKHYDVEHLWVDSNWQRKGIATELYERAIGYARTQGAKVISVPDARTDASNALHEALKKKLPHEKGRYRREDVDVYMNPVIVKPPLYHVTHAGRIDAICQNGLQPDQEAVKESYKTGPISKHRKNRIFMTAKEGVRFWFQIASGISNYAGACNREFLPVVIRINRLPAELEEDVPGTQESGGKAYLCACSIPPEDMDVFDSNEWVPATQCGRHSCYRMFRFSIDESARIVQPGSHHKMMPPELKRYTGVLRYKPSKNPGDEPSFLTICSRVIDLVWPAIKTKPYVAKHCAQCDREHEESDRQYCHVGHVRGVICFAAAIDELPLGYKLGLAVHEIGHIMLEGPNFDSKHRYTEQDANDAGCEATGIRLEFKGKKTLEYADPRNLRKIGL